MSVIRRLVSIPEFGISAALLSLITFFWLINPNFLLPANIAGILRAMSYTGIVAIGLTLCLLSGTFDISVGATAGLASVVFARLVTSDIDMIPAVLITIAVGLAAGFINSVAIVHLKVTAFITTISTMFIFRGLATLLCKGFSIYPLPESVNSFGSAQPLGVSWAFIIMVVVMLILAIVLSVTVWGLCVRATGSDLDTARNNEVNVIAIQTSTLVICGGLAALAGIMVTCILGAGQATAGTGWELYAIAAAVIGGISLAGYSGSMLGLFLGLLTVQVILNGIIVVGIPVFWQNIVIGSILLGAVIIDTKRRYILNVEVL